AQRQQAKPSSDLDAGYFTDVTIEPQTACIEPFTGASLDALLRPGQVTVVEFSATWCGPCKVLRGFLQQECAKYKKTATPIRFYSVDVDEKENQALGEKYAKSDLPHLYIFVGSAQRYHHVGVEPAATYTQLLAGLTAEKAVQPPEQTGKMGLSRGLTTGLF